MAHDSSKRFSEVQRLTQAMTEYYVLSETCSAQVRNLSNGAILYEQAVKKWEKEGLCRPPPGDRQKRAELFAAVDEICKIQPRSPEEYAPFCFWSAP